MYFIWVFLLLLNEYEEEGKSDPGKKEWPRKGMSQEMTQKKRKYFGFLQTSRFHQITFSFYFIWKYNKKRIADEHYNRSKIGS